MSELLLSASGVSGCLRMTLFGCLGIQSSKCVDFRRIISRRSYVRPAVLALFRRRAGATGGGRATAATSTCSFALRKAKRCVRVTIYGLLCPAAFLAMAAALGAGPCLQSEQSQPSGPAQSLPWARWCG